MKTIKKKEKKKKILKAQRASCWCTTPHNCEYYCNIAGSGYVGLYSRNLDHDYDAN